MRFLNIALCVLLLIVILIKKPPIKVESPTSTPPVVATQTELESTIDKINQSKNLITTFSCDDLLIHLSGQEIVKLKANIKYQKDKNFRMTINSILGKECDIGSNDSLFWFWSKRMEPKGLYYALNKDLALTRLKAPFNPVFIRQSLGLDSIDPKQVTYGQKNGNRYEIILKQELAISRVLFINYTTLQIDGQYLYEKNKLVASSEVTDRFPNGLPKTIIIKWLPENLIMRLDFQSGDTNQVLSAQNWQMPNISPKINMAYN